jgi:hypothetical protein
MARANEPKRWAPPECGERDGFCRKPPRARIVASGAGVHPLGGAQTLADRSRRRITVGRVDPCFKSRARRAPMQDTVSYHRVLDRPPRRHSWSSRVHESRFGSIQDCTSVPCVSRFPGTAGSTPPAASALNAHVFRPSRRYICHPEPFLEKGPPRSRRGRMKRHSPGRSTPSPQDPALRVPARPSCRTRCRVGWVVSLRGSPESAV